MNTTTNVDTVKQELEAKQQRLDQLMDKQGLDAVLLGRTANFAWLTGGKDATIVYAMERGEATLLFTRDKKYVVTIKPEAERLRREEGLDEQGYQFSVSDWWLGPGAALQQLTSGLRVGSDLPYEGAIDISAQVARLRYQLLPAEIERYRALGQDSAVCMKETCQELKPGMTEWEIGGILSGKLTALGIFPTVLLVGSDERIYNWKHPVPTHKKLDRYGMVVLCARRAGLIVSLSRFVHFGPMSDALKKLHATAQRMDAEVITATKVGARISDIFAHLQQAYNRAGFPEEWQAHWQGGAAGYEPREFEWTPGTQEVVLANQAFAWNPSIPGAKCEDNYIIYESGREIITELPDWPKAWFEVEGEPIARPDVLVR